MAFEVWMAAAEVGPLAQTGGLGDVLRALPNALVAEGLTVRRFLPAYGFVPRRFFSPEKEHFNVPLGAGRAHVRFLSRSDPSGVTTTLVDCPELFDREEIYGPPATAYPDNAKRFTLFCRAICEFARRRPNPPSILHGHDWPAALLPVFVKFTGTWPRPPRTVFTIHNLAYQGRFPRQELDLWSLDPSTKANLFRPEGVEFFGGVNFLKASLQYADRITTVSPTYAREILTPAFGEGLDGLLKTRGNHVTGILNGADYDVWNPATDRYLAKKFTLRTLKEGKRLAQRNVRETLKLARHNHPLVAVVGRFAFQKGVDVLLQALPDLLPLGIDLAVLGTGELSYAAEFQNYRIRYPKQVGLAARYDDPLSHRILAAADFLLVPSRYEPCGLSQLYAMRYGTIPIVHRTGGMIDTVVDPKQSPRDATGFCFQDLNPQGIVDAVVRALEFQRKNSMAWDAMQKRAMQADFSWSRAAKSYAEIYRDLAS
ncbi:MAG: glycogen synthase GlgA [Pseudomonadota bacterium]